jgi:hypothetical protein
MQEHIEQRLKELKTEFEAGQKMLADLEARQLDLRNTLLRISGAVQVLEEVLSAGTASERDGNNHRSELDLVSHDAA